MLGIDGGEALILLVLAIVLVGPERLPRYAAQLGRFARGLRDYVGSARERVSEETGLDWEELDPRRYDPRRIVREALTEPAEQPRQATTARGARPAPRRSGPAPLDDEAT
ncbi:MAG TPA: Sec-independent protein translocase TatB [Actinotalea sp.]|nr:Sec-independent protein translocase TatB [Actinotalea sp.]